MPRPLRIEFAGAIYHLMSRGDRREPIFHDDEDRKTFLRTLQEACEKTHWQIHAWCLMAQQHGIQEDSAEGRIEFQRRMEQRRSEGEAPEMVAALRRGWRLGAADFLQRLTEKLGRRGRRHERASERRETDTERAERLVREHLAAVGWTEGDLARQPKAHVGKVALARRLRQETPMTRAWVAQRLGMGSASYVSHLLGVSRGNGPSPSAPTL